MSMPSTQSRPDLRHDPARRRAVAGHLAEHHREARDRPPARAPRRRRHRGRLSDRLAGRLRGGPGDRPRGRRPDHRRPRPRSSRGRRGCRASCTDAERPRIHTFISTSDIHIVHQFRSTREDILAQARAAVAHAKSFVDDVEFSPMDATRADLEYTAEVCAAAIEEGATTINIPEPSATRRPRSTGPTSRACTAWSPSSRTSSSPCTATTTSASPSRTRTRARSRARARSSARSTASASARATRRSRRS